MRGLRIVGLLLLLGLSYLAWLSVRDWRYGFVSPTQLAQGESPMAALCRIRAEFLALPDPVHDGFTWHERWERKAFAAYTSHFGPYWEIDLNWPAWRFARRYSRLEIVAAIGPYMSDPQLAPKATAILAGLPPGSREGLDRVQTVSILLAEPAKFLPGSLVAAPWSDEQLHFAQSSLASLYGMENSASRLEGGGTERSPGTLEGVLLDILEADHSLQGPQFETVDVSDRAAYPDFDAILRKIPPPAPRPSFNAFVQRWPHELLATALFPYALKQTGRERYIRLMGREAAYWPLHAGRVLADEAQDAAYRRETGQFARSLCHGGQLAPAENRRHLVEPMA